MSAPHGVDRLGRPKRNPEAAKLLQSILDARPDNPNSAMLEIVDRCNEVCVHCYQVQGEKGEMDTQQIFKILDDLAEMGVLRLTISGGEATLRHDFLDIMRRSRELGFLVTLFTNGLTMTEELAQELGQLGLHAVEISLYSQHAAPHDFVTGVEGSFDKTVAGIRYLRAAGVFVVVKTTVMSLNEDTIDGYFRFVEHDLGAHPRVSPVNLHAREDGDKAHFALNPGVDLAAPERRIDSATATPLRPRKSADNAPCGAGAAVHVEPHGEMRPCSMLPVDLGDARTAELKQRHEHQALRSIRELNWGAVHGCRDCALSGYCLHCYAHALDEVGDALGPYPSACTQGRMHYARDQGLPDAIAEQAAPLGPYGLGQDGQLVPIEHVVTDEDEARAQAMPWVRKTDFVAQSPAASAQPGELVQLRRPGRKAGTDVRVPAVQRQFGGDADPGQR